jgi:hypothetical protein
VRRGLRLLGAPHLRGPAPFAARAGAPLGYAVTHAHDAVTANLCTPSTPASQRRCGNEPAADAWRPPRNGWWERRKGSSKHCQPAGHEVPFNQSAAQRARQRHHAAAHKLQRPGFMQGRCSCVAVCLSPPHAHAHPSHPHRIPPRGLCQPPLAHVSGVTHQLQQRGFDTHKHTHKPPVPDARPTQPPPPPTLPHRSSRVLQCLQGPLPLPSRAVQGHPQSTAAAVRGHTPCSWRACRTHVHTHTHMCTHAAHTPVHRHGWMLYRPRPPATPPLPPHQPSYASHSPAGRAPAHPHPHPHAQPPSHTPV